MNHAYYQTTAQVKLTSPTLTRLYGELATQTEAGKASDTRYRKLMSILRPDIGPSVIHHSEPATHATIDLSGPKVRANREIGGNPTEEERRKDDIARIARGEPLEERPNIQSQLDHEARTRGAIEVVLEDLEKQISEERRKLGIAYLAKIKPQTDAQMQKFKKALADFYAVHREISDLYRDHRDSGIGFPANGPMPDFMGSADDFFHTAAHHGFVK
jgi:hypothetical protein